MFSPMEIAVVAGVAILIFGADKLPKLARSAGLAKKEFMVGQAEADIAAEKARDDARRQAAENQMNAVNTTTVAGGQPMPPPDPVGGTTPVTAPPRSAL